MKVIADSLPNADAVLLELLSFMETANTLADAAAPYSISSNGRALPRFIAETCTILNRELVKDFSKSFPHLHHLIENGSGTNLGVGRLHDACYTFNQAQQMLHSKRCLISDDATREQVYEQFRTVVADIVVYICIQFALQGLEFGEVQLAVSKHCEKCGLTPEVFFGILKDELTNVERSWYAWEVISPMYRALNDFDPTFVSECEESLYPLSDDMAKEIVEGRLDVAEARGQLVAYMRTVVEKDVDVTPSTLVSRMQLK